MQKLHLVGFTTDHEGLILSARRGSRSGGYLLAVDEAVEEAIEALLAHRAEEPEPDDEAASAPRTPRVESTLPVREIQARLRQGRSIADVAKAAGVDVTWVERFAPPILAERAQMISRVQSAPLRRARLGPSALPIGDAVRHHLADRAVVLSPEEFASAWTARQLANGRWAVRFTFHYRGRNNVLRFDLDESSGEVTAADRQSGQLGYVTPTGPTTKKRRQPARGASAHGPVSRPVVSTGFRADPTQNQAVSRSAKERERAAAAMRKAVAQRAVDAERAAVRRERERVAEAARVARAARAAAAQAARDERANAAAERAKAAAAKKRAAEQAKAKEKKAKEKKAAAKKAAVAKAAVKKAAVKKAVVKKAVVKKAVVKKAVVKKAVVKKAVVKKAVPATTVARPARLLPGTAPVRPRVPTAAPPKPLARSTPPAVPAAAAPVAAAAPAAARPPVAGPAVVARGDQPSFSIIPRPASADRASFRQGAAESAGERSVGSASVGSASQPAASPPDRSSNGPDPSAAPRPRLDRPRRTRPLRAT